MVKDTVLQASIQSQAQCWQTKVHFIQTQKLLTVLSGLCRRQRDQKYKVCVIVSPVELNVRES